MTILTTTEDGAVNGTASDIHNGILYIGLFIEEYTRVTLTRTEEVAGDRVFVNLTECTRHTECGSSAEVDRSRTGHVGHLVTAINVCQDMAARDVYRGITTDRTCSEVPLAWSIRIVTGTTAEDVTIEGMSIGSLPTTAICISVIWVQLRTWFSKYIMRSIDRIIFSAILNSLSIRPACTFRQRRSVVRLTILDEVTSLPFCICITAVQAIWLCQHIAVIIPLNVAVTDLSTGDCDICIGLHITILCTAIYRTLDEGVSTDSNMSLRC